MATNSDEDFEKYLKNAIKLREKQMGRLNLPNAVTYCNYAKHMVIHEELELAKELITKAL